MVANINGDLIAGLIDVEECVSGLISVLENDHPLNSSWYDYKHEKIPW